MPLPDPLPSHVKHVLSNASDDERYFGADPAVRLVFEQWPRNIDPQEVLVKVVVLNRLYSTNVLDVYGLRDHIVQLKIDSRLDAEDEDLVNALADFRKGNRKRWLISFASKYCAWHRPDGFQMFDSRVEWILWEYRKEHRFADFGRFDLRDYPTFVSVLGQFRSRFGLDGFSRKQIDKFLWIEATKAYS